MIMNRRGNGWGGVGFVRFRGEKREVSYLLFY